MMRERRGAIWGLSSPRIIAVPGFQGVWLGQMGGRIVLGGIVLLAFIGHDRVKLRKGSQQKNRHL